MVRIRAAAVALTGALMALTMLPAAPAAAASAPVSDDFNGTTLNPALWTVQGGGPGSAVSVGGGSLNLTIAGGTEHDLFPGSESALRVVQNISNGNFQLETKFKTLGAAPPNNFQDEGIVVQQNAATFLRFDVYSDGSSIIVFSAAVAGTTVLHDVKETVVSPSAPIWLRVTHTGPTWLYSYSTDGVNWTVAGKFDSLIPVTQAGVYVGDSGPAPVGWTAQVDYFHRITSSPITISDDQFNGGSLDPKWTFVNPGGDAVQSMDGTHAVIDVPAPVGANTQDPDAPTDNAPRLVQTVANSDFSFDAKFDSQVTSQFQEQGLVVEQDATHFMHVDIVQDFFRTELVVKTLFNGTVTTLTTTDTTPSFPGVEVYNRPSIRLRWARVGDTYALSYSYDGQRWTAAYTFFQPLVVARVGVYAGANGGPAPAFTAKIDSFVTTAVSTANPTINVWYGANQTFGANGQPQRWVNILGDVASANGLSTLTYTLNGGAPRGLSLGENDVRLVAPGEFNAEIDYASLRAGANTVVFTATDATGRQSTSTVTVNKVTGKSWPLPTAIKWTGTNPNTQAQVADGHWTVQPDGSIRNGDVGYDRLVTIGQASTWAQYIVTAQVKIASMDPDGSAVGIIAGWQGATGDLHGTPTLDQPRVGHPFPAAFLYDNSAGTTPRVDIYANTDAHPEQTLQSDGSGLQLTSGVFYTFKMRVTDNAFGGSLFQVKVWKTGTAEPASWLVQADGDLSRGSVVLAAHRAVVSFGTVSVVGRPGAPTISSVAPRNGGATVAFAAPANNGGTTITGYRASCTSSNGGVEGSATGTTTPIVVTGLDNSRTYRCTVVATNAVGTGSVSTTSAPLVPGTTVTPPPPPPAVKAGYWMVDTSGRVYPFGDAKQFGSAGPGVVAIAARRDARGYWTTDALGNVSGFGAAHADAGRPSLRAGELVSTISATPSGNGYWLFTSQGRVFPHGDARFFGDMGNVHLNGPIVSSTATPTGGGYFMVGSDGGVFSFGDAKFHGSTGKLRLNRPVVGLAPTADNRGYWLVASDGGVFAFGAPFRGSLGGTKLNKPVNGIISYGNGYLMVASDGGVFDFSNKAFVGSLGGRGAGSPPVVGIVSS